MIPCKLSSGSQSQSRIFVGKIKSTDATKKDQIKGSLQMQYYNQMWIYGRDENLSKQFQWDVRVTIQNLSCDEK